MLGPQRLVERSVDLDRVKIFGEICRLVETGRFPFGINDACPVRVGPPGWADAYCFERLPGFCLFCPPPTHFAALLISCPCHSRWKWLTPPDHRLRDFAGSKLLGIRSILFVGIPSILFLRIRSNFYRVFTVLTAASRAASIVPRGCAPCPPRFAHIRRPG